MSMERGSRKRQMSDAEEEVVLRQQNDDDEEGRPAWMRYLPHLQRFQPKKTDVAQKCCDEASPKNAKPAKSLSSPKIKVSSNPFSTTHLLMSKKRKLREDSDECYLEDVRELRSGKKYRTSNVEELSMLVSFVKVNKT